MRAIGIVFLLIATSCGEPLLGTSVGDAPSGLASTPAASTPAASTPASNSVAPVSNPVTPVSPLPADDTAAQTQWLPALPPEYTDFTGVASAAIAGCRMTAGTATYAGQSAIVIHKEAGDDGHCPGELGYLIVDQSGHAPHLSVDTINPAIIVGYEVATSSKWVGMKIRQFDPESSATLHTATLATQTGSLSGVAHLNAQGDVVILGYNDSWQNGPVTFVGPFVAIYQGFTHAPDVEVALTLLVPYNQT